MLFQVDKEAIQFDQRKYSMNYRRDGFLTEIDWKLEHHQNNRGKYFFENFLLKCQAEGKLFDGRKALLLTRKVIRKDCVEKGLKIERKVSFGKD